MQPPFDLVRRTPRTGSAADFPSLAPTSAGRGCGVWGPPAGATGYRGFPAGTPTQAPSVGPARSGARSGGGSSFSRGRSHASSVASRGASATHGGQAHGASGTPPSLEHLEALYWTIDSSIIRDVRLSLLRDEYVASPTPTAARPANSASATGLGANGGGGEPAGGMTLEERVIICLHDMYPSEAATAVGFLPDGSARDGGGECSDGATGTDVDTTGVAAATGDAMLGYSYGSAPRDSSQRAGRLGGSDNRRSAMHAAAALTQALSLPAPAGALRADAAVALSALASATGSGGRLSEQAFVPLAADAADICADIGCVCGAGAGTMLSVGSGHTEMCRRELSAPPGPLLTPLTISARPCSR
jgi:hypothetical protein